MRTLQLAVLLCLFLVQASCDSKPSSTASTTSGDGKPPPAVAAADKPKDLIVGKWTRVAADPNEKGNVEFLTDGSVTMAMDGVLMKGKYKFLEDELVQLELTVEGQNLPAQKLKVKVSKDELTTTDDMNRVDKFKRGK